ncbi:GlxA family transcriptional regulator [Micromonospora sp. 4G57]|uniref:GlxA family transcriptional regulator n=1 Tax=Micromonospora sicca TaxID=2202420 RepID=A0ABU5JKQ8_9ACTN|nr:MULTISPECIES: GlxA family transcriptional regulator [unclassified Micromonospora]MDZ5443292.1 GlxA family transcriptional regulator [Micromonospora sp. 4G57]MDZ5493213.1 GlxA family transcriptional regulator [Micromonospora sp. 4G53]
MRARGRSDTVVFVVYDRVRLLDVTGPLEVLTVANEHGGSYRPLLASPDGRDVVSSAGARLGVDLALPDVPGPVGTLVVPGAPDWQAAAGDRALLDHIRRLAAESDRTASVCAGAFPLAATGLLDGRRVTTHWDLADQLAAQFPKLTVDPDPIFIADGRIITSAGITAGIDLTLALVEADFGPETARAVARHLVVFMQRPGGQSQFSVRTNTASTRNDLLRRVLDTVAADPARPYDLAGLAALAGVSARHLGRLFRSELGITPGVYLDRVRVEAAQDLLERGDDTLDVVARRVGFGSPETMRRAFLRERGVTPGAYRSRFRTTGINPTP